LFYSNVNIKEMRIKTNPEIVSFPTNEIVQKEVNNFWIKPYLLKNT